MGADYTKSLYKEYKIVLSQKEQLEAEHKALRIQCQLMQKEIQSLSQTEKTCCNGRPNGAGNQELIRKNLRLRTLANTDGTNSAIPTSRTPLSKKKVIPNARKSTDRPIGGGQKGHPKKKLESFAEEEVTEHENHSLEACPYCGGGEMKKTGNELTKDELDYEIVVVKRRHHFLESVCKTCGKRFRKEIPPQL